MITALLSCPFKHYCQVSDIFDSSVKMLLKYIFIKFKKHELNELILLLLSKELKIYYYGKRGKMAVWQCECSNMEGRKKRRDGERMDCFNCLACSLGHSEAQELFKIFCNIVTLSLLKMEDSKGKEVGIE